MLYRIFLFFCLSSFFMPISVKASALFTVQDVHVDVTAESALAARENALVEAQIKAFKSLMKRISLWPDVTDIDTVTGEEIINMVQNLSVIKEKNSKVRYLATVSVAFHENRIKEFLQKNAISFVSGPSDPILILPVYSDTKSPNKTLFSDKNIWLQAWQNASLNNPLVPMVLPFGDLKEISLLSDDKLQSMYDISLESLHKKYQTSEAFIVEAFYDEGQKFLTFYVYPFQNAKSDFEDLSFTESTNLPLEEIMKRAINRITAHFDEDYRNKHALRFDTPSSLTTVVPLDTLADLIKVRKKLDQQKMIKKYILHAVKKEKAQIELFYAGSLKMLSDSLKKDNLILLPAQDDIWMLKEKDKATPEELAEDPFKEPEEAMFFEDESEDDYLWQEPPEPVPSPTEEGSDFPAFFDEVEEDE